MRIMLDTRAAGTQFPGVKRYVEQLAGALASELEAADDELNLVVGASSELRAMEGGRVACSVCDYGIFDPRQESAVQKIADDWRPDVFHTPFYLSPGPAGVPTVLTMHDCIPMKCPSETLPQERLLFRTAARRALEACSVAIAVSETTRFDCLEFFPSVRGKFLTIPHGVDGAFRPQSAESCAAVAAKYGIEPGFLLYIGANRPHKNLTSLVAGYARAKPMLGGRQLVFAGAACTRERRDKDLIQYLGQEEDVKWIGAVARDDVPALMGAAGLLVLPSFYEGFGLPVLEAMAVGTPVVCSGAPGLRELGGNSVVFFDPASEEELAQALLTGLVEDTEGRRLRVESGKVRARLYTWENVAASTKDAYRKAMRIGGGRISPDLKQP